jgi:hypothetical protein
MATLQAPVTTEFFDEMNSRRGRFGSCALTVILIALLLFGVWNSEALIKHGAMPVLIICWCLLVIFGFSLPRFIGDLIAASRGEPDIRIGEQGIWSRNWRGFGWIEYSDLQAIIVVIHPSRRGHELRELKLKFRDYQKYLRRLNVLDRISLMAVVLLSRYTSRSQGDKTFLLGSWNSFGSDWDRLMVALDPLLAAHGITKEEYRTSTLS